MADDDVPRPYLDLAREIHREMAELAAGDADVDALAAAIASVPERERGRIVRSVFEALPPERQWEVLARAFGDREVLAHLEDERAFRLEQARRALRRRAVAERARAAGQLLLDELEPGESLRLGLFRREDVRAALRTGSGSTVCARELRLRTTGEPGRVRVIDDEFNPRRGLFTSAAYDESTWQTERLEPHAVVGVGAADPDGHLEPVLYSGGRLDVVTGAQLRVGRLHLGYAVLDDVDLFAG